MGFSCTNIICTRLFTEIPISETIASLKSEKARLEENKILIDNELKQSSERERKSKQNIKNLLTKLETVESEKGFLEESIKELNDELVERNQSIEKVKLEMEEINVQLAHFKHEYNLAVQRLKDAKADFQRCHEKEADVKDRYDKCKRQVDDTNDKLTSKIVETVNLLKKIKKMDKKNRELQRDMERCKDVLNMSREEVKAMRLENKSLKDTLRDNDTRFIKMKNQVDKILRERDLIANQMIRRTDENDLLEREVSTLKATIERGNGMYQQRVEDLKMMTNEIKSLRSQCKVLKRGLENTADMRHEVFKLHRMLHQERSKEKVLEQEMITPLNVHRWRKLNNFDPKRAEMLKKCQRVQRNALLQLTKIAKLEEIKQALEDKIAEMEKQLSRQLSAKVQEKLMVTRVSQ